MELRGSLGGSVRLFLQRDAVDGGEIGSEPRRVSSTGAIVAPLVARQGLEIRVRHDPGHSGWHVDFASRLAGFRHEKDGTTAPAGPKPWCRIWGGAAGAAPALPPRARGAALIPARFWAAPPPRRPATVDPHR